MIYIGQFAGFWIITPLQKNHDQHCGLGFLIEEGARTQRMFARQTEPLGQLSLFIIDLLS